VSDSIYSLNSLSATPLTVKFCSPEPGRGKTHGAVGLGVEEANLDKNVFIVQPTQELNNRTEDEILPKHKQLVLPPHYIIHGGTVQRGERVPVAIGDHMNGGSQGGQILFGTHAVLPLLEPLPCLKDWHLIIDEIPQIVFSVPLRIPDSHPIITRYMTDLEVHGDFYMIGKNKNLLGLAENKEFEMEPGLFVTISWPILPSLMCSRG
jgi:hypothetical protein